MGQEFLRLKIATPTLTSKRDVIDFSDTSFAVQRITLRKEINIGGQVYELDFISQEAIKNTQRKNYDYPKNYFLLFLFFFIFPPFFLEKKGKNIRAFFSVLHNHPTSFLKTFFFTLQLCRIFWFFSEFLPFF